MRWRKECFRFVEKVISNIPTSRAAANKTPILISMKPVLRIGSIFALIPRTGSLDESIFPFSLSSNLRAHKKNFLKVSFIVYYEEIESDNVIAKRRVYIIYR